jgi:tripartite-type tricarboxylate transporter receptor subunit TctC
MHRLGITGFVCGVVTLLAHPVLAQDNFYKGKTVSVVVGSKSGSLSVTAQMVGRHLGRHIPGNPNVINQQMPGGAHLVATAHVYNVAEADGLTILAINPQVAVAQLAKMPAVRFDVRKFHWLGSSGVDGVAFAIRPDLPYTTFKDLQSAPKELIIGATAPGSNSYDFPMLLKEFAGAKFKLIAGYAANTDIMLAIERREVDGWTALGTTVRLASERGTVRPLLRARTHVTGLNHLAVDEDLTTDPLGKALMAIRGIPLSIGRAYAVRPGTPPDRVAILREALAKTIADPKFQSDVRNATIEAEYIPAADVIKGFDELMNQPPHVLEAMGKYIKPGE